MSEAMHAFLTALTFAPQAHVTRRQKMSANSRRVVLGWAA